MIRTVAIQGTDLPPATYDVFVEYCARTEAVGVLAIWNMQIYDMCTITIAANQVTACYTDSAYTGRGMCVGQARYNDDSDAFEYNWTHLKTIE